MKKIGFTIGKFAPLHKGHQYLIDKAIKEMDEFYIVIYDTDLIGISTEERAEWIKKIYPSAKVILAKNPPMQYGLDEESVNIQTKYLKKVLGDIKVTDFYSSEKYGEFVSRDLKVNNRVVDYYRETIPICGTEIRKDFNKYSNYINDIVMKDILKKKLNNNNQDIL